MKITLPCFIEWQFITGGRGGGYWWCIKSIILPYLQIKCKNFKYWPSYGNFQIGFYVEKTAKIYTIVKGRMEERYQKHHRLDWPNFVMVWSALVRQQGVARTSCSFWHNLVHSFTVLCKVIIDDSTLTFKISHISD